MKRAYIFIALATVLFSSMEITLKGIAGQMNPVQITVTRFLIGGVALLPLARSMLEKHHEHLDLMALVNFAWLGFIGIVVSMTLFQLSVSFAPASVVAVLFSCNPVFVMIFAMLLLHLRIRRKDIVSLVFECLGILLLITPWNLTLSMRGICLIAFSTMTFALYGVLGKTMCARYSGIVVTCGSFLLASAEMLLLCALSHVPGVVLWLVAHDLASFADIPLLSGYTADNIWTVLYVGIGVTGVGYASYFMAMEVSSPVMASLVFFFKPVLAPILAWLILSEPIPLTMICGIALILLGSFAALLPSPEVLHVLRNGHWGWKHGKSCRR